MKYRSTYEESALIEEIGEAVLRLDHVRDRYLVLFDGTVYARGRYEATQSPLPVTHDGEARGIVGRLYALVPEYPGDVDPESQRRVELGWASANYYVEDRLLRVEGPAGPAIHAWNEDDLVELLTIFERYAQRRFPDAARLYRFQTMGGIEHVGETNMPRFGYREADERVLRRLGYHLLSENRRRPDGKHNRSSGMSIRTWTK